jgi:hypothetical protein
LKYLNISQNPIPKQELISRQSAGATQQYSLSSSDRKLFAFELVLFAFGTWLSKLINGMVDPFKDLLLEKTTIGESNKLYTSRSFKFQHPAAKIGHLLHLHYICID